MGTSTTRAGPDFAVTSVGRSGALRVGCHCLAIFGKRAASELSAEMRRPAQYEHPRPRRARSTTRASHRCVRSRAHRHQTSRLDPAERLSTATARFFGWSNSAANAGLSISRRARRYRIGGVIPQHLLTMLAQGKVMVSEAALSQA